MPSRINLRDIYLPPNLVSLSRILFAIPIGYFLWSGTYRGGLICVILLTVAAFTDFLDGFLARRLNQITNLGLLLDPLADKFLTLILIIELVFFRNFPIWLAAAVILRDLAIMLSVRMMIRRQDLFPSSNLTGKYYFASVAILLSCYIIRFEFGREIFTYIVIILFLLSIFLYARCFWLVMRGRNCPVFSDNSFFKVCRTILTVVVTAVFLYRLYVDVLLQLSRTP